MIIDCTEGNIEEVFEYIGEDYGKCLYIYIDLKKYGLEDENFNVWIQYNELNKICAIISEYYGGIQIYSKQLDFNAEEIADFIKEKDSNVLFAVKEVIDDIKQFLPEYKRGVGIVGELTELKYPVNPDAYSAPLDEIEEIVRIIAEDECIGKPYGFESLYAQYIERKEDNFGRNFVLRDSDNHEIICHAGTYAELPELAVMGGVITSIPYRGKGYSKQIVSSLCSQLLAENKRIFSIYYSPSAKKLHSSVGFKQIAEWSKLFKM